MRFEDWDVLLFPSGTHDSHVPLREYRVECHTVEDERLSVNGNSTKGEIDGYCACVCADNPQAERSLLS